MRKLLGKLTVVDRMIAVVIVLIFIGIISNKKKNIDPNEIQITDHDRPGLKNKYGPEIGLMQVGDSVVFPGSNDQHEIVGLFQEKVRLSFGGKNTDFTWRELVNAKVRVMSSNGATVSKTKPPSG